MQRIGYDVRVAMMASSSSARSKPGLSLIEDEYWYAGPLSERKAEVVLTKLGEPGSFLVRDSLLPEADYVLSVNSGKDIWHYDVKVLPTNVCIFNKYTFTSLPDAVTFYMENRLGPVFLKDTTEPVVSETLLKSFGPNLIKIAASESVKPPRTSPFVTADNSTTTSTQSHGITTSESQQSTPCTTSPQIRRLTAPESLRNPHTPPAHNHHTSASQSRRLAAPESLKPPHTSSPASACNQQTLPSQISNTGLKESFKTHHEVSVESHTQSSVCPLRQPVYDRVMMSDAVVQHAPSKSSALPAGDGWTDSLSGTGSQVSIGSHSPKPQSVSHFAIDLEDGVGNSQSQSLTTQSQTSEVDCTYIGPSNAESVFVTSGYVYIKPPSSDFSPNQKNNIKDQLLKDSPKDEKLSQEANRDEVCKTVSSVSANTAVLNVSPITKSTPVKQGNIQHATNEGSMLQATKTNPDGIILCATTSSEQQDKMPSVADRRLAFEKQFQVRESDMKVAPKPGRKAPAIPKRVSSISNVVKQQDSANGDNNITSSIEEPSSSLGMENTITEEGEEPPPTPPPLETHPGVLMKSESEEQLEVRDDSTTTKSAAELPQEGDVHRPKPKERRVSAPAVKSEPDQNISRSLTLRDNTITPVSEVTKPTAEVEAIPVSVFPEEDKGLDSVHIPAPPPQKEASLNGSKTNDNTEADDGKQGVNAETFNEETDYLYDEQPSFTFTFGHTGTSNLLDTNKISEESTKLNVERSGLDGIDPSKSMGAEVSTFKPVPKPRLFQRHSMYVGGTTPTVIESSADDSISPATDNSQTVTTSLLRPPTQPYSFTPDMKRSSMHFPTPENKRKMIFRAQSMSMTSTTGSASPRMVLRGEQKLQMPPGFVMYSRSQEAVVGRHPTMTSNTLLRSLQASTEKKGDGDKKATAAAAPMNTKRASLKKRRSFFKRK